jgi:hypothetical protein
MMALNGRSMSTTSKTARLVQ